MVYKVTSYTKHKLPGYHLPVVFFINKRKGNIIQKCDKKNSIFNLPMIRVLNFPMLNEY